MTPTEFFAKHGANLAAARADLGNVDDQALAEAAGDNNVGSTVAQWRTLTGRLLIARVTTGAAR